MHRSVLFVCVLLLLQAVASLGQVQIELHRRVLTSDALARRKRDATLPLGGGASTVGLYFAQITVGGQLFKVAVDTGSSNLYLALRECKVGGTDIACPVLSSYYDRTRSSNSSFLACNLPACEFCKDYAGGSRCVLHTVYGDRSEAYAYAVRDTISVGSGSRRVVADANFGAMYETGGPFATDQTDGLWGLGYAALGGRLPTVMDAFAAAGQPNIFSMCMNAIGGALVIGGINPDFQVGNPTYTPITEQAYYTVDMTSIQINGAAISGISNVKTVIDTGTTLFLLPRGIYNSFKQAFQNAGGCSLPGMGCDGATENTIWDTSVCWYFNQQTLSRFPTIRLGFQGLTLDFTPDRYFLDVIGDRGACKVLGLDVTDSGRPIVGASFLQYYNVIFDRQNSRVGFARVSSGCNASLPFVPQAPFYRALPIQLGPNPLAIIIPLAVIFLLICVGVAVFLVIRARRARTF